MIKVIKGRGKSKVSNGKFIIKGLESCHAAALSDIIPLIKSLGFTKVTSHTDLLDIGDGTNTLAMNNPQSAEISRGLEIPTSVIATDVTLGGSQSDTKLAPLIKRCAAKGCTVNNYTDDKGAIIVNSSGYVIGHYDARLNLLVLTDLTHSSSGITKLGVILEGVKSYREHFGITGGAEIRTRNGETLLFPRIDKKLMIGLDPELAILNKANVYVSSPFGSNGGSDEIGSDCGDVEIRPKPGTPKQLVKTVRGLYERMDKLLDKESRLLSSGGSLVSRALGGHIHFNIQMHKELTVLLDDFIGKPMKRMNGSARGTNSYGQLSQVKLQPHGFEYRTPPSFVGKPDLFAGVIAVAYCIGQTWKSISNTGLKFKYAYGDSTGAYKSAYAKLLYYKTYEKEILDFLSYVYDEKKTIEERDVLAAWQVRDAIVLEDVDL